MCNRWATYRQSQRTLTPPKGRGFIGLNKLEAMSSTGVVIIGRNEGDRLRRCLLSVIGRLQYVVYVDSGSTDGSIDLAQEQGANVVVLDANNPFTAARGRNTGFAQLKAIAPDLEYVQFVDGDCELIDGWIEAAIEFLQGHTKHAVVCGRLRERHPEASMYNRLCDIEWNGPVGDIEACGGISMIRAIAFAEVGGMNSVIVAGEEPEMCLRLRHKGWLIARLDREMAWHDANMTRFGQWWKRAVRSGYGAMDVCAKTGGQVFAAQVKRARLWTIGWSLALLCVLGVKTMLDGTIILLAILAVIALYPLQILRIAARMRRKGLSLGEAYIYGCLMMIGKWAELYGQFSRYLRFSKSKSK